MLSPLEIGAILGVVVLLFGVKRLPELGTGLGEAISNFKRSYRDGTAIDVTPSAEEKAEEKKASESKESDDEEKKSEQSNA